MYVDVELNALPTFKSLPEYSRAMAAGMLLEMGVVAGAECAAGTPATSMAVARRVKPTAWEISEGDTVRDGCKRMLLLYVIHLPDDAVASA